MWSRNVLIPPYASVMRGHFTPEIEIFRGYWLVSWFKREFAAKEIETAQTLGISAEELLNRRLKEVPAGCEGLIFQPYFTPNTTMPVAKGAVIGFSDVHTRIHIYRAIIEGINFALMDGLKLLEKQSGHKFLEIYEGGGGAQSDEIARLRRTCSDFPLSAHRPLRFPGSEALLRPLWVWESLQTMKKRWAAWFSKKISFPRICSSIRYTIRCMKKFSEIFTDACLHCTSV